jgi:hypothetical protein
MRTARESGFPNRNADPHSGMYDSLMRNMLLLCVSLGLAVASFAAPPSKRPQITGMKFIDLTL